MTNNKCLCFNFYCVAASLSFYLWSCVFWLKHPTLIWNYRLGLGSPSPTAESSACDSPTLLSADGVCFWNFKKWHLVTPVKALKATQGNETWLARRDLALLFWHHCQVLAGPGKYVSPIVWFSSYSLIKGLFLIRFLAGSYSWLALIHTTHLSLVWTQLCCEYALPNPN